MRGGRFQQKTSEDATLRNAEALFESRTVVEIREVEANTRKEIEEKKEELRQLVGASYRDLIESADSIANMKNSCYNVALNIQHMESGFASLKHSLAIPHPPSTPRQVDMEKKKREKLYGIGCRVKYVVDTPEKIWGCLDEHMYLEGAQRYFRARKVQTLLTESEAKGENLSHFPLLLHQWSLVEALRAQISQRSRDRLLESGLDVKQYAVALAAVAVIDELNPTQIVLFFFETRRAWLRGHLSTAMASRSRTRNSKDDESDRGLAGSDDVHEIALILSKAANILQISLCHAGQLFLEVNGDAPIFFSTVLSSPPGSQLFGGIPNPDDEVRLWKLHWEKLETRMSSLAGQYLSDTCKSWINTCQVDLSVEGKLLMDCIESGKSLERMEGLIRSECDSRKALEGSLEWLESAFGKPIDSPWDYVIALLLKEPLNLWSILFERMFVERAKGIVILELAKIDVDKRVDDILVSINSAISSQPQAAGSLVSRSLGFGSTDLIWYTGVDVGKRIDDPSDSVLGLQARAQEEESLGISSIYLGSDVSQLKDGVDTNLKHVLEDFASFLHAQQIAARSEELGLYLQERCCTWMANIINRLLSKILAISSDSSELVGRVDKAMAFTTHTLGKKDNKSGSTKRQLDVSETEAGGLSPSVEKALVLGRILIAFSHQSWTLPDILHPSMIWCKKEAATSESSLPWLPSSHHRTFWLEVKHFSTGERNPSKSGLGKAVAKEDGTSEFLKLQVALKYASLVAHSIWVSWSVDSLTAVLARDLVKDDDLASSSPLKGWEETALTQLNEKGDEIEVKLPLPAMPSPYVISFLFKSCQEVYRVGGHALDKLVLHLFVSKLFEKVLLVYDKFTTGLKDARSRVSEKGLLQLLFDLRFIGDVLSGGERSYPDPAVFSKEESHLSFILSSSNLAGVRELLFQGSGTEQQRKKWRLSLQERLSNLLDPIDWATYEPPLWENEQQSYQRCAVIFGFLVQLRRLYKDTAQRPPLTAESNTLKVSASIPRFTYLPISTPSLTKKTAFDESGSKLKSMISSDHASKLALEDDSGGSVIGAKPLLKSLFNQVGSRFGEGTLKLGSMLTDSQVSRLKDRSAAAISTFGDILPSQAAGLFSSFTAGTSRSEAYY